MTNNDYELEEMEDAAVNRSRNLKRGLAIGGAVAGSAAAGVGLYAAVSGGIGENGEEISLEPDELLSGANAVAEDLVQDSAEEEKVETPRPHINVTTETVETPENEEAMLDVKETGVLLDENGEVIGTYDEGTYDGKRFIVVDSDGNGKGDIIGYDANGNGIIEEHEITSMDNSSYQIGHGVEQSVYMIDESGNKVLLYRGHDVSQFIAQNNIPEPEPYYDPYQEDIREIHNDFEDEKTGETYRNDLAQNNDDYNNNSGEQYFGIEGEQTEHFAYEGETHFSEELDYGYTEPQDDFASTDTYDSIDDHFSDGLA